MREDLVQVINNNFHVHVHPPYIQAFRLSVPKCVLTPVDSFNVSAMIKNREAREYTFYRLYEKNEVLFFFQLTFHTSLRIGHFFHTLVLDFYTSTIMDIYAPFP